MKKLIALLCAAALCLAMPMAAFAAEAPDPQGALQETAVSPRAANLSYGIGRASNTAVTIHAIAYANGSTYVTVSCQLQRLVNGTWLDYGTGVSNSGRGKASASKTIEITKGYEYRTKASSSTLGLVRYSDSISM